MNAKFPATVTALPDKDDAPELTEAFFEQADEYIGEKLVLRGRPPGSAKVSTTVRFDTAILDTFRATGPGWQTRMNAALADWLKDHSPA